MKTTLSIRTRIAKFFYALLRMFLLSNQAMPSIHHLDQPNRRRFRSPFTHNQLLLALASEDEQFLKGLPNFREDYLLVLAVCGRKLVANLYEIREGESLRDVYEVNWMREGLYLFHVDTAKRFMPITLEDHARNMQYNPYDVVMSYQRDLTNAEERLLAGNYVHTRELMPQSTLQTA